MTERQAFLISTVSSCKDQILEAEHFGWTHPEIGFQEWKTTAYYQKKFEALGYTVHGPTDIPGFYVDIDTHLPGPKLLIFGELDALYSADHPAAVDGMVHACGHHAQCAAVYGVAAALKQPGILDSLCGSIRLMLVPAEETAGMEQRIALREQGTIQFYTGKPEYMRRGYMNDCDIAFMLHTISRDPADFSCDCLGANGSMQKTVKITGKAAHGSKPDQAINAQNAAALCLMAINSLQETFHDDDHICIQQVFTKANTLSHVPGEAEIAFIIRGASLEAILDAEQKITRALFTASAAIGATVEILDSPAYGPMHPDPTLLQLAKECMETLVGSDQVDFRQAFNLGCSDMGDVSAVIPSIHPFVCGAVGNTHSSEFFIADPERACVNAAKLELLLIDRLLSNHAKEANKVIRQFNPAAPTIPEYIAQLERMYAHRVSTITEQDGNFQIDLQHTK